MFLSAQRSLLAINHPEIRDSTSAVCERVKAASWQKNQLLGYSDAQNVRDAIQKRNRAASKPSFHVHSIQLVWQSQFRFSIFIAILAHLQNLVGRSRCVKRRNCKCKIALVGLQLRIISEVGIDFDIFHQAYMCSLYFPALDETRIMSSVGVYMDFNPAYLQYYLGDYIKDDAMEDYLAFVLFF